jgi:hypothetical protein
MSPPPPCFFPIFAPYANQRLAFPPQTLLLPHLHLDSSTLRNPHASNARLPCTTQASAARESGLGWATAHEGGVSQGGHEKAEKAEFGGEKICTRQIELGEGDFGLYSGRR